MREIEQIYFNEFGVAFHWKKDNKVMTDKVQLVFKETGFYFSYDEVRAFSQIIEDTCKEMHCGDCCHKAHCHKFLLRTPLQQIDLAVTRSEIEQLKDLIEGTIFNMDLCAYINKVCRN